MLIDILILLYIYFLFPFQVVPRTRGLIKLLWCVTMRRCGQLRHEEKREHDGFA